MKFRFFTQLKFPHNTENENFSRPFSMSFRLEWKMKLGWKIRVEMAAGRKTRAQSRMSNVNKRVVLGENVDMTHVLIRIFSGNFINNCKTCCFSRFLCLNLNFIIHDFFFLKL